MIAKILKSNKFLWRVFGNDKDPLPPDWVLPNSNNLWREFYWFFIRNPFHNLTYCFENSSCRNYTGHVWSKKGRWNIVLPFVSYKGKRIEWYIGIRPPDGGFGIAIRRKHEQ